MEFPVIYISQYIYSDKLIFNVDGTYEFQYRDGYLQHVYTTKDMILLHSFLSHTLHSHKTQTING